MSSGFTSPGQAFEHTLSALKGYSPDFPLDVRGKLHSSVDLTVVTPHAGRCVYADATLSQQGATFTGRGPKVKNFHMGCAGALKGPPIFLWPGVYDNDISNKGTPAGTNAVGSTSYGVPPWVSVLPGRDPSVSESVWGLVGLPGYELETTEYDAAATAAAYASGQWLRAVTLDNNVNGGVLTNQNASAGGGALTLTTTTFTLDTDTIVGIVSGGTYTNSDGKSVLSFYTYFRPGTR